MLRKKAIEERIVEMETEWFISLDEVDEKSQSYWNGYYQALQDVISGKQAVKSKFGLPWHKEKEK